MGTSTESEGRSSRKRNSAIVKPIGTDMRRSDARDASIYGRLTKRKSEVSREGAEPEKEKAGR